MFFFRKIRVNAFLKKVKLFRLIFNAKKVSLELYTGRQVRVQTWPEPENISPNPARTKIDLKPKAGPKKNY